MKRVEGTFTFLGSGGSMGVPVIGCDCAVCTSDNPKNKRLRPAGLVRVGDTTLLIDVGPDFREQALRENLHNIDGLLLTHTHYDHIAGLDDLRIFFFIHKEPVDTLLSQSSLDDLKVRYHYLFKERTHGENYTAQMNYQVLPEFEGEVKFKGLPIQYMTYKQGPMFVNGFRFGDFAYISDICDYTPDIFEKLWGVKTLVLSALRHTPSHVHLTVDEAIDFSKEVGAKNTYFTHMAHDLEHEKANEELPEGVELGYDGLTLPFRMDLE